MKKRKSNRLFKIVVLLSSFIFLDGFTCDKQKGISELEVVHLKAGNKVIEAEVANKEFTRETGLMFRREMERDHGMLFVFPDSSPRAFWMKNTVIPLSIAFLDEKGIVLNILEMPPETLQSFLSKGPAQYALEMNANWFPDNHIKEGDRIEGVLLAPQAAE